MPSKSIFRQPGAQHFQLVHRSQRDPLINDPDASQHVLKPVVRENAKKGKSRADLESSLSPSDPALASGRSDFGEASLHGVYYDDTVYDYMQHLRPVGEREEGFESILVEKPKRRITLKTTSDLPISLQDLPPEVLPSASELPRDFESQAAVQSSISGLQPDMDPHLRQTLEALEDDAYVDDDLDDDFFGELIKNGERDTDEPFEYEFRENGHGSNVDGVHENGGEDEAEWVARFAAFKREQARKSTGTTLSDSKSEADTVGQMPVFPAAGSRRRRRDTSDASGFSMSSSSIFRSDGLRDLDDRFDQESIEKEYIEDEGSEEEPPISEDSDSAPELITSREDFDSLMDDFLHNYEVSGGKMKPSLRDSGPEKLESSYLSVDRGECLIVEDSDQGEHKDDDVYAVIQEKGERERWDVETVLTTYTNLENHPRLIMAREERKVPKILLDPRTGFPLVEGKPASRSNVSKSLPEKKAAVPHVTTRRPSEESAEEKRERKRAVKAERQTRRVEKKEKKGQFSAALKQQSQALARNDAQGRKL